MKNVIIRRVKKEDIPSIVDIKIKGWQDAYKRIIDDEYLNNLSNEYDSRIKKMEKTYMNNGFIIAELDNQIVGFCSYIFDNSFSPEIANADCELSALYVKPELKSNGIGTLLFEYVTNEFKKQNKQIMVLWCLKENEPSKKFYTKMGGKIIKEKIITIGNKEYIEVCFAYDIKKNK